MVLGIVVQEIVPCHFLNGITLASYLDNGAEGKVPEGRQDNMAVTMPGLNKKYA